MSDLAWVLAVPALLIGVPWVMGRILNGHPADRDSGVPRKPR
jgi:hypothetical protein